MSIVNSAFYYTCCRKVKVDDNTLEIHPYIKKKEALFPLFRSTTTGQTFVLFRDLFGSPRYFKRLMVEDL